MMRALGTGLSPQACRQARIKRLSRRRHRPSRVHRANSVYSVPNGMSQSWLVARHCMPQNAALWSAMIALRNAAPVSGGFGPERVDEGIDIGERIQRGRGSLGGGEGGAHMQLFRWLLAMAADIVAYRSPARQPSFPSK